MVENEGVYEPWIEHIRYFEKDLVVFVRYKY